MVTCRRDALLFVLFLLFFSSSSDSSGFNIVPTTTEKFGTAYAASECVKVFDGRFFGGRKLSCHFWDGVTNYTIKEEDEKEEVGDPLPPPHPICMYVSVGNSSFLVATPDQILTVGILVCGAVRCAAMRFNRSSVVAFLPGLITGVFSV